jgi:hypothetical protein
MAANTAAAMTPAVTLPSALVNEVAALVPDGDAAVVAELEPADVAVAVAAVWLSPADEVWLPPVALAVEEQTAEVGKLLTPTPAQILSAYSIVAEAEENNKYIDKA